MTDYALRCTQQDRPQLIAFGIALGVLQQDPETGFISGTNGGAWDEIGPVYDDAGNPVLDSEGQPYWHANLRTEVSLATRSAELQIDPGNLAQWFVTDQMGVPVLPSTPARVWL